MTNTSGAQATPKQPSTYIGRFAPSPSGPLHHGSLLAALASYLDAKASNGKWLLRIDDVDQHRCVKGSENTIIKSLTAHGLVWDGEIERQSTRSNRYQLALEKLADNDHIFYCNCQRKQLRTQGNCYLGTCRAKRKTDYTAATKLSPASHAIRFDISTAQTQKIQFNDRVQGLIQFDLKQLGDFIIKRRDSLFAYQLAVVVDDIDQNVSDIVRGCDLLASSPWQLALFEALGEQAPRYVHLPLLTHAKDHSKLSKQTGAKAINDKIPTANLANALRQLNQSLPKNAVDLSPLDLLNFAIEHWDIQSIKKHNIPF